jgi:hypothetical protein
LIGQFKDEFSNYRVLLSLKCQKCILLKLNQSVIS